VTTLKCIGRVRRGESGWRKDTANASRLLLTKSAAQTPPGQRRLVFPLVMFPCNGVEGTSQFAEIGHNWPDLS
jgi:hypothetical protein